MGALTWSWRQPMLVQVVFLSPLIMIYAIRHTKRLTLVNIHQDMQAGLTHVFDVIGYIAATL